MAGVGRPGLWGGLRGLSAGLAGAALALLLAYALGGMLLAGVFPVGESKADESLSARVHGAGAALGFMALLAAGVPLALLCLRGGRIADGVACLGFFVPGLAAFTLFVMSDKERFRGGWIDREGTWQRLSLLLMYLPPAWLALRALV